MDLEEAEDVPDEEDLDEGDAELEAAPGELMDVDIVGGLGSDATSPVSQAEDYSEMELDVPLEQSVVPPSSPQLQVWVEDDTEEVPGSVENDNGARGLPVQEEAEAEEEEEVFVYPLDRAQSRSQGPTASQLLASPEFQVDEEVGADDVADIGLSDSHEDDSNAPEVIQEDSVPLQEDLDEVDDVPIQDVPPSPTPPVVTNGTSTESPLPSPAPVIVSLPPARLETPPPVTRSLSPPPRARARSPPPQSRSPSPPPSSRASPSPAPSFGRRSPGRRRARGHHGASPSASASPSPASVYQPLPSRSPPPPSPSPPPRATPSPSPSFGRGSQFRRSRGDDVCYKCRLPGHWASECRTPTSNSPFGGGSQLQFGSQSPSRGSYRPAGDTCYLCGELGHWAIACPSKPAAARRIAGSVECYTCSERGHYSPDCPNRSRRR
ncbi:hypothetical protein FB45DRAFT_147276 [Roridomyces roridus]|uniref:CCHC-type domain-containing protein n=1 Tax=Roridomyces roridus TaxID=1738132 RepID=A0AAD7BFW1_9AGAR|nr:hypothetical protein FB45DRAFT_147276 [Roridomyces roridus]